MLKKTVRKTTAKKISKNGKAPALKPGSVIPPFELKDQKGVLQRIEKGQSDYSVLFFYPRDNTPGCTIESRGFSNELDHFHKLNARVFGISGGSEKSKANFCAKYGLRTIMLADPDYDISRRFCVYGSKSFMGKKTLGIHRTTFVLDKNLKVLRIFDEVDTKFHPAEVLLFIAALDKVSGKTGKATAKKPTRKR